MKAYRPTKGWKPPKSKFRKKFPKRSVKEPNFKTVRKSMGGWSRQKWEIGMQTFGLTLWSFAFMSFLLWLILL